MRTLKTYFRSKPDEPEELSFQDEYFSIPSGFPHLASKPPIPLTSSPQKACHFFRLPYELREQIYQLAFGKNNTFHVDLQYRHAWLPGDGHANLNMRSRERFDETTPKEWRWWSCVCHQRELMNDTCCLNGEAGGSCCNTVNTRGPKEPSACFIGASGWLKSCREAYADILPFLLSTNTLYISSLPLIQSLESAFSPTALSLITSLKIKLELWPIQHQDDDGACLMHINRAKRFSMYTRILSQFTPSTLPQLKTLRIEFISEEYSDGWDIFTKSVLKGVPGQPGRVYMLSPTDSIIAAYDGKLDLQLVLKPEHAFVIAHKLGIHDRVIRGVQPGNNLGRYDVGAYHHEPSDGQNQYWKVWRDLPATGADDSRSAIKRGYWLYWDSISQEPLGYVSPVAGPWCVLTGAYGLWSWFTDEHGFVYRRTIMELNMDWELGLPGFPSPPPTTAVAAAAAVARENDRRLWFPDVDSESLPLRWLRERTI